ncbi:MAG TPA: heme ABC transporter permease, partial [Gammaproteobacteria bacterium]|nr:heme ABC transporter permease [Gammaproteobacteria bacterium]
MQFLLRKLRFIYHPPTFIQFSRKMLPGIMFCAFVLFCYSFWGALYHSPPDYQQGEGVRILYIHVPCAILSLAIYTSIAMLSFVYLVWRIKIYDLFAKELANLGAIYTLLALVTGSLWGKPMWGTWWVWDARLTSELILLFLYLAYILLRQSLPNPKQGAKACAMLAMVGFIDIPIVHFSVEWFQTLHQGGTLFLLKKTKMHPDMVKPLLGMLAGFF